MNKITPELIDSAIISEEVMSTTKTTIVILTLRNGFEVVGTSGVVDPARFDLTIGYDVAYRRAVSKVWELEGYLLQDKLRMANGQ
jgi:hypothetical protein